MANVTGDIIADNSSQICMSDFQLENATDFSGELAHNESTTIDPTIDFVFNGLGLFFLTLVGATANILSVIVLSHRRLKSSLTTLLLGLTISDTVVIFTSFLIFSLSEILYKFHLFSWFQNVGRPFLLPWLLPIALTAQMSSVYFTVVITLERYVAVCLPLQARSLCTRSSAKWSSFAIIVISFLYNIPRWFEFEVVPKAVNCTTGEVIKYTEAETDFRLNELFITYYINWAYLVFMYIIPFTVLFYFNAAIYKQTRIHRTIRRSLSPSTKTEHTMTENIQLAGMLLGIVITFIACNMLAVSINLMENMGMNHLIGNLIPINNFLVVLCSSTNFIFYCVFGTEFRRRLRKTLSISSHRKSSCTRSEVYSDKDNNGGGVTVRQRIESLQIPHIFGTRSRSNSNSSTGNNNGDKGRGSLQDGGCEDKSKSDNDSGRRQFDTDENAIRKDSKSICTVITIVSEEL